MSLLHLTNHSLTRTLRCSGMGHLQLASWIPPVRPPPCLRLLVHTPAMHSKWPQHQHVHNFTVLSQPSPACIYCTHGQDNMKLPPCSKIQPQDTQYMDIVYCSWQHNDLFSQSLPLSSWPLPFTFTWSSCILEVPLLHKITIFSLEPSLQFPSPNYYCLLAQVISPTKATGLRGNNMGTTDICQTGTRNMYMQRQLPVKLWLLRAMEKNQKVPTQWILLINYPYISCSLMSSDMSHILWTTQVLQWLHTPQTSG